MGGPTVVMFMSGVSGLTNSRPTNVLVSGVGVVGWELGFILEIHQESSVDFYEKVITYDSWEDHQK